MIDKATTFQHSRPPRSLEEAMRQAMEEKGVSQDNGRDHFDNLGPKAAEDLGLAPPAAPGDYVITLPRGVEPDPDLEAAARQWFHSAGLPQGVAAGIAREYCRHVCEPPDAAQSLRSHERAMTELRREWGPDYDRKLNLAYSVIDACRGGDALDEVLADSGLVDNIWLLRTLAALGEMRAPTTAGDQ